MVEEADPVVVLVHVDPAGRPAALDGGSRPRFAPAAEPDAGPGRRHVGRPDPVAVLAHVSLVDSGSSTLRS